MGYRRLGKQIDDLVRGLAHTETKAQYRSFAGKQVVASGLVADIVETPVAAIGKLVRIGKVPHHEPPYRVGQSFDRDAASGELFCPLMSGASEA